MDKYMKRELELSDIIPILNNYSRYPIGSKKLLFTSNHDENTYWGTEYEKYGICAKAMAVFTCTWPGIPLIYSGQEKPNLRRLAFFEKDFIDWEGEGIFDCGGAVREDEGGCDVLLELIEVPNDRADEVLAGLGVVVGYPRGTCAWNFSG